LAGTGDQTITSEDIVITTAAGDVVPIVLNSDIVLSSDTNGIYLWVDVDGKAYKGADVVNYAPVGAKNFADAVAAGAL